MESEYCEDEIIVEDPSQIKSKCLENSGFFVSNGLKVGSVVEGKIPNNLNSVIIQGNELGSVSWLEGDKEFTRTYKDNFNCKRCGKTHICGSKFFNFILSTKKISGVTSKGNNFKKKYKDIVTPVNFKPGLLVRRLSLNEEPIKLGSQITEIKQRLLQEYCIELSDGDVKGLFYCLRCGRRRWNMKLYHVDEKDVKVIAARFDRELTLPRYEFSQESVLWRWIESVARAVQAGDSSEFIGYYISKYPDKDHDTKSHNVVYPIEGLITGSKRVLTEPGDDDTPLSEIFFETPDICVKSSASARQRAKRQKVHFRALSRAPLPPHPTSASAATKFTRRSQESLSIESRDNQLPISYSGENALRGLNIVERRIVFGVDGMEYSGEVEDCAQSLKSLKDSTTTDEDSAILSSFRKMAHDEDDDEAGAAGLSPSRSRLPVFILSSVYPSHLPLFLESDDGFGSLSASPGHNVQRVHTGPFSPQDQLVISVRDRVIDIFKFKIASSPAG